MKPAITLALGLLAGAAALAQAPATLPPLPRFDTPAQVKDQCDRGLAQAGAASARLLKRKVDGGWLRAWDDFNALQEDLGAVLQFMAHVHPDKAVREAAEACELRWQDFNSTLNQNPALFRAMKAAPARDAIDRELRSSALDSLRDAGASLPPAQRRLAKQLQDQMQAQYQAFERNLRDAGVKVAFDEAELAGVPDNVWKNAPRDAQGKVLLGVETPSYVPVLQYASSPAARERMWRARTNSGGEANLKLLAEIVQVRQRYARIFGDDSYAGFVLHRRMAGSPQKVQAFLDDVKQAVSQGEQRELEAMRLDKARHLGQDAASTTLQRWDLLFYEERQRRERYSVDQEAFRPHFPPQASLDFVMRLVETLMGVRYEREADVVLWHPDVQSWRVRDAASGRLLGRLVVDPFPRDGKYGHAAVWPLRSGQPERGRTSLAALVVNVDRKGLSLDELETLLHEFGHAVHANLSATRHVSQAGTSVKLDFVEAPSQMLEDWVYDRQVMALFKDVCPSCTPVPDAMLAQAAQARDFGKGTLYARQHLYASYDLALNGPGQADVLGLWQRMEGATPLGHVPGTIFPATISHLAGHYGAGYYSYLWSLVLAMDMRTAFGDNRLDAAVGRRYRDTVLANGSQRPPQELLRSFLGREPGSKGFFDYLRR